MSYIYIICIYEDFQRVRTEMQSPAQHNTPQIGNINNFHGNDNSSLNDDKHPKLFLNSSIFFYILLADLFQFCLTIFSKPFLL